MFCHFPDADFNYCTCEAGCKMKKCNQNKNLFSIIYGQQYKICTGSLLETKKEKYQEREGVLK